jgi:hypothetical protein
LDAATSGWQSLPPSWFHPQVRGGVRCALAPAASAWLQNTENFNATIIEQTGKESLLCLVGAPRESAFAFFFLTRKKCLCIETEKATSAA